MKTVAMMTADRCMEWLKGKYPELFSKLTEQNRIDMLKVFAFHYTTNDDAPSAAEVSTLFLKALEGLTLWHSNYGQTIDDLTITGYFVGEYGEPGTEPGGPNYVRVKGDGHLFKKSYVSGPTEDYD